MNMGLFLNGFKELITAKKASRSGVRLKMTRSTFNPLKRNS